MLNPHPPSNWGPPGAPPPPPGGPADTSKGPKVEDFTEAIPKLQRARMTSYIQAILRIKDDTGEIKPWSYNNREHWGAPVDGDSSLVFARCSRQTEKSSTMSAVGVIESCLYPRFEFLYVSPAFSNTKDFSVDRVDPLIEDSPWIQKYRVSKRTKKAVQTKNFTNGSVMRFRYAYHTADRTRGIRADRLCIDEMQLIRPSNVPVIERTLTHSNYKRRFYVGTPLSNSNHMEYWWKKSTQCEWIVPCLSCNTWNILGEKNIGTHGPICSASRCRRPLNRRNGQWHAFNSGGEHLGFRITSLMVPLNSEPGGWLDWKNDVLVPYEIYPKVQFYNEVLGLPCDDAMKALTREEVIGACQNGPQLRMEPDLYTQSTRMFAGIDWGEGRPSRTVLTICGFYNNKFTPVCIRRFEPNESDPQFVLDEIVRLIHAFRCVIIAPDASEWGSNGELARRCGGWERVYPMAYTGSGPKFAYKPETHKISINRTHAMDEMFMDIKQRRVQLPTWVDMEKYESDFTSPHVEFSPKIFTRTYGLGHDQTDDTLHAFIYAKLGAEALRLYSAGELG